MNDRFDELLNDTLQQMADAEPLHGLEERIEERIRTRASRARRIRRMTWFAVPVAACAGMAIVWTTRHPAQTPSPQTIAVHAVPTPQPAPVTHHDMPVLKAHVSRHTIVAMQAVQDDVAQNDLPKLDIFPAPPEDTPERRAVIALTEAKNQAALRAASELKEQQDSPIQIAEIHIQPLAQETNQ